MRKLTDRQLLLEASENRVYYQNTQKGYDYLTRDLDADDLRINDE